MRPATIIAQRCTKRCNKPPWLRPHEEVNRQIRNGVGYPVPMSEMMESTADQTSPTAMGLWALQHVAQWLGTIGQHLKGNQRREEGIQTDGGLEVDVCEQNGKAETTCPLKKKRPADTYTATTRGGHHGG